MQNSGKLITVGTAGFCRRKRCRLSFTDRGSNGRRKWLPHITKTAFQLFNALAECPFQTLCVRNTCLKAYTTIIRFAEEPLQFRHMRPQTFDDGIGGLLEFFF